MGSLLDIEVVGNILVPATDILRYLLFFNHVMSGNSALFEPRDDSSLEREVRRLYGKRILFNASEFIVLEERLRKSPKSLWNSSHFLNRPPDPMSMIVIKKSIHCRDDVTAEPLHPPEARE